MNIDVDRAIGVVAGGQHGVFDRRQVLDAGGTDKVIGARLRRDRWRATGCRGVYVLADAPFTHRQRLWIAHLGAGRHSVVSHEAAGHLERLPLVTGEPVVLTVDHPRHLRIPGAVVHQISDLTPRWVWNLEGLPVTTTARTIVDLSSVWSRAKLGVAVDQALAGRRVSLGAVAACLQEVLRPGKRGLHRLVAVLDERGAGYVPPMSELERLLLDVLRRAGLPDPVRQYALPGRGAVTGLVDAAYPEARLLIEADGRSWHDRIATARRDRLRDNESSRLGWLTLRFTWEEVTEDPDGVAATVLDTLTVRLAQLRP